MTGSTHSTSAASTGAASTGAASTSVASTSVASTSVASTSVAGTGAGTGAGTAARGSTCADVSWTRPPEAFDAELDRDVSAERHVAAKVLIALAIVGLVICARLVFFG